MAQTVDKLIANLLVISQAGGGILCLETKDGKYIISA